MTKPQRHIFEDEPGPENRSALQEMSPLLQFAGPPDRFLLELLTAQCRLSGADCGAVFRKGSGNQLEILAAHPALKRGDAPPNWIATVFDCFPDAVAGGKSMIKPEPGNHPSVGCSKRHVIVIPIQGGISGRGAAAYAVRSEDPADLQARRQQLELTLFLLNLYEIRLTLGQSQAALTRMSTALEIIAAANRTKRFTEAAMAVCNELATRWHCNRVSLGFLKGRYVHVQAISHTENFSRKMKLLQDMEAAMEECLDQDVEIIFPAPVDAMYVSRAAAEFSKNHGPITLLGLPIRSENRVLAVIMLERPSERPFTSEEIENIRLICDLFSPRLLEQHENDRWFGARMAATVHRSVGRLVEPRHTLLKLAAVFIFALVVFLTFAKGEYRVEAPFSFETIIQQAVVAPYDTYIKNVSVIPGDKVDAGKTILGVLENSELRLQLAALKAELMRYKKQMASALRDRKTAEAQIAQAGADKIAAEIHLVEYKIGRATLVAPITGRIVSDDLSQQVGAPVKTGDVMFEIAPVESLRAELYVPEDMIADVKENQQGVLAAVGHPDQKISFVVERINPVANVVNNRNVFRVRAGLLAQHEWMLPGMEGIAKISARRESYAWIGSRRVVNWLRMKLWI